jgi:hypothetical protein
MLTGCAAWARGKRASEVSSQPLRVGGPVPELRRLRAFVAVAEERNFTRAAERLHLGQQAVSKSIGQLERSSGVGLPGAHDREVRLTPGARRCSTPGREAAPRRGRAFAVPGRSGAG